MSKNLSRQVIGTVVVILLVLGGIFYFNMDRLYEDLPYPKETVKPLDVELMSSKIYDDKHGGEQMQVFLLKPKDELGTLIYKNYEKALEYAHISYQTIDEKNLDETLRKNPNAVLVLMGEISQSWPREKIQHYVYEGGKVLFTNRFQDPAWDTFLGIEENRGYIDNVKGMKIPSTFFPGYPEISNQSDYISNSMLDVSLNKKTKTYITADKHPFLWTYSFGKGKVVYLNNSSMQDKTSRGILLQSLTLTMPAMATGQFAGKIMFIDDFPAPVVREKNKRIYKDYHMNYADFYNKIWWPDMKKISKTYHVPYTGGMIGTYENDPNLPKSYLLQTYQDDLLTYGRQLLATGGELALHGYNHQSLIVQGEKTDPSFHYRPWQSRGEMERALHQMKPVISQLFPKETIRTYVPPSNTISQTGIDAVAHSFPEIGVISSLYLGTDALGSLVQEFGYDKRHPGLYNFPRITSGYQFTDEDQFQMADVVANFGVVSHFVHPDDVLDEQRSEHQGWEGLKEKYARMQKFLAKTYPYLQSYRQSDAQREMAAYQNGKWDIRYFSKRIELHGYNVPRLSYFLLRVNDGKKIKEGSYSFGSIQKLNSSIYTVRMTRPDAVITLEEGNK